MAKWPKYEVPDGGFKIAGNQSIEEAIEAMARAEREPRVKPKFKWPCYKRKPHGPHTIEEGTKYEKECPGLRAHPLTQIGGGYAQEDIPE